MAISATHKASVFSGTNAASYATGSWTPTANRLAICCVENEISGTTAAPTITGNGLTWTQAASYACDTSGTQVRISVFVAKTGASPSAGAVTADFGGVTQAGCNVIVDEIDGADLSGTALQAIVQSKNGTLNASGTSETITLDSAITSGNASYGVITHQADETTSVGSGYSALGNGSHPGPSSALLTEYKAAGSQTVDASWVTSIQRGGIALEIKAAATTNTYNLVAALDGTSTLTSAGKNTFTPAVTLNGTSTLTSAGKSIFTPAATLNGTSTLTSAGKNTFTPATTLAGTSALTSAGQNIFSPGSTLNGSSALTVQGSNVFSLASPLDAMSALTAAGFNSFSIASAIAGTSALSADLTVDETNSYDLVASLAGESELIAQVKNSFNISGAMDATSLLTSSGRNNVIGAATLDGTSALNAIGSNAFAIASALNGDSQLIAEGKNIFDFVVNLAATSQLNAVGYSRLELASALIVTSELVTRIEGLYSLSGNLEGTSELTVEKITTHRPPLISPRRGRSTVSSWERTEGIAPRTRRPRRLT